MTKQMTWQFFPPETIKNDRWQHGWVAMFARGDEAEIFVPHYETSTKPIIMRLSGKRRYRSNDDGFLTCLEFKTEFEAIQWVNNYAKSWRKYKKRDRLWSEGFAPYGAILKPSERRNYKKNLLERGRSFKGDHKTKAA